jgi:multidrug resistance efflux pump
MNYMASDDVTKNLSDHELLLQLLGMFREVDARQRDFDARLQTLERKVDERLYDTRPMWEAVQTQIADLRSEQEKEFRKLHSKFDKLAQLVYEIYAEQREHDRRLNQLESPVS